MTQTQRSSEATLASSFTQLQLKKFEFEFSVDPLFKKASADFDEGGAKGLLLNHLAIDSTGRIVFDSSDDAEDASAAEDDGRKRSGIVADGDGSGTSEIESEHHRAISEDASNVDIGGLGSKFFPDLVRLDEQDICPSLKNFDMGDPAGSLDIPLSKTPDDWRQEKDSPVKGGLGDQTGIFLDGDNVAGFEDDDGMLGGFDIGIEVGFGEGGDVWAKSATIKPQMHTRDVGFEEGDLGGGQVAHRTEVGDFNPDSNQYMVSLHHRETEGGHGDILSYFDNALKKNWAGPEHWRIRRIKDNNKTSAPAPSRRKEKQHFEIDFASTLNTALAETIYTPATSISAISLPKAQWKSKTRNLLPDDKHFNSRQLLRLFLKPKARIGTRSYGLGKRGRTVTKQEEIYENEMDEAFWARRESAAEQASPDEDTPHGDYDANFFQDDGLGCPSGPPDDDDEFADAREVFSPDAEENPGIGNQGMDGVVAAADGGQEGAFGTQLVTQSRRLRPEYVQYARVAKKVDVRRLKEEMWKGIGLEDVRACSPLSLNLTLTLPQSVNAQLATPSEPPLKFTSIMNSLQQVYPKQAMADISTSYCFICLLHLANEKGLTLGNEPGLEELSIRRDFTAELTQGGE